MADDSIINLGLPDFPDEELEPRVFGAAMIIHRSIKNLARGVSDFAGVDELPPDEWGEALIRNYFRTQNLNRLYPQADVAITAGQLVNLYNNAGFLRARLANASSAATMAHGIAMTSAGVGQRFMMYFLRGYVDTVGGMIVGTLYWVSTVAGGIQNSAPAAVGTIAQPVGIAASSVELLMDIPLSYRQN